MKNKINLISFCIITLVLTINLTIAFNAMSNYGEQTPLTISPGEQKEVLINIYPNPSDKDVKVEATIEKGMNIASITDTSNIYDLSSGNPGLVHMNINIPLTAKIGSEYLIVSRYIDKTTKPSAGMVGIEIQATNTFKVKVVAKPGTEAETPSSMNSTWLIVGIIAILVVIAIIWFAMKKK